METLSYLMIGVAVITALSFFISPQKIAKIIGIPTIWVLNIVKSISIIVISILIAFGLIWAFRIILFAGLMGGI